MNILVADDDAIFRMLIRAVLTKLGHCVTHAGNGREAIEDWLCGDIPLIICDWEDARGVSPRKARGAGRLYRYRIDLRRSQAGSGAHFHRVERAELPVGLTNILRRELLR
jgi:DNA-binding NarL/FixJ family response regulator